jgi:argininosuccinate lyase
MQGANDQQIRDNIANIRTTLWKINKEIRQSKDSVVEEYRSAIGADKEQFESLTQADQQHMFPLAYQALQNYNTLEDVIETLNRVNGDLMDYSGEQEHQKLKQSPEPNIELNETYDNEPTRQNLSP